MKILFGKCNNSDSKECAYIMFYSITPISLTWSQREVNNPSEAVFSKKANPFSVLFLYICIYIEFFFFFFFFPGWVPKVTFTYLKSSALANDLRLVLQKPVDWEPGDEIVVGRTGLGDAQQQEEVAIIESINNTELYLRSPLRYLFKEKWGFNSKK